MNGRTALGGRFHAPNRSDAWNSLVLLRLVVLAGTAGMVLAALGPFGTYAEMAWPERLVFWEIVLLGAAALHIPSLWLAEQIARNIKVSLPVVIVAAAFMAAMPTTLLVTGLIAVLYGMPEPPNFVVMFGYVVTISVPMQGLSYAVLHAARKTVPQIDIGPNTAIASLDDIVGENPSVPSPRSTLLDRLPAHLGSAVQSLKMQDHYVRVTTPHGSALLLMRMSDAEAELAGIDGARVHRSWWVARSAVTAVRKRGRAVELVLANGLGVPVSRDRQDALRKSGWLDTHL